MSRFEIQATPLAGLVQLQRQRREDTRGIFTRFFCAEELKKAGWSKPIAQINHSSTRKAGTVRGLHYQMPPHAEMKLVTCIRGAIWDVVVDIRQHSSTFLRWHAVRLGAEQHNALLVPEGFAHGFQALSDDVEVLYCTSAPYVPDAEVGLCPTDARLNIEWPLPVIELSERDASHARLDAQYQGGKL